MILVLLGTQNNSFVRLLEEIDKLIEEKIIKEEFRKGYKIGMKVIRHAMVIVAN